MTVIYPSLSNWLPPFTSSQSLGWRTTEVFGPTSDLPRPFSALYSHRKTDGQNHKPTNVMLCGCSGATLPSGGTLAELLLIDVPLLGGCVKKWCYCQEWEQYKCVEVQLYGWLLLLGERKNTQTRLVCVCVRFSARLWHCVFVCSCLF